jgi:hypothetical protein
MALPPDRLDDLREIARALGHPSPGPGTPAPQSPRGWAVIAMIVALFALGWTTARTCGFRGCAEAPPDAAVRVARVVESPIATPQEMPTSPPGTDAPNAIGALLDRERRVALPVAVPTVAWSPVAVSTPIARTRPRDARPARVPTAAPARVRSPLAETMPTPETMATPPPPMRVADVSGRWLMTNTIADSSYEAYRGLRIRFRLDLQQRGTRITGRGRKFTVNDRPVLPAEQTQLDLEGEAHGEDVIVRFVEHGARRRSSGTFHWRLSADGRRLQGRFESSAAATGGASSARRDG